MLCPLCSHWVQADAAACPRCRTNFRNGRWQPMQEWRSYPGPGRFGLKAVVVVVMAAIVALTLSLLAGPGSVGALGANLLSVGLPVFLALGGAGLVAVVVRARQRGL